MTQSPEHSGGQVEAVAWLVAWRQNGSECSRVFQFETDALEWAAKMNIDEHVSSIELVPLYTRAALSEAEKDNS